jgi:hypothetical protein
MSLRNTAWLILAAVMSAAPGRAAEERFSTSVPATDYAAAGLGKLSPEELARLDALVRDFKSGVLAQARREAEAAAKAQADAEAKAARAEAESRAARAKVEAQVAALAKTPVETAPAAGKVTVAPGTKVEFSTVESRIAGVFRGWEPRAIFTLENGQRWQVTSSESYVASDVQNPAVKIVPGILGSFWMTVEGVKTRVKVAPFMVK